MKKFYGVIASTALALILGCSANSRNFNLRQEQGSVGAANGQSKTLNIDLQFGDGGASLYAVSPLQYTLVAACKNLETPSSQAPMYVYGIFEYLGAPQNTSFELQFPAASDYSCRIVPTYFFIGSKLSTSPKFKLTNGSLTSLPAVNGASTALSAAEIQLFYDHGPQFDQAISAIDGILSYSISGGTLADLKIAAQPSVSTKTATSLPATFLFMPTVTKNGDVSINTGGSQKQPVSTTFLGEGEPSPYSSPTATGLNAAVSANLVDQYRMPKIRFDLASTVAVNPPVNSNFNVCLIREPDAATATSLISMAAINSAIGSTTTTSCVSLALASSWTQSGSQYLATIEVPVPLTSGANPPVYTGSAPLMYEVIKVQPKYSLFVYDTVAAYNVSVNYLKLVSNSQLLFVSSRLYVGTSPGTGFLGYTTECRAMAASTGFAAAHQFKWTFLGSDATHTASALVGTNMIYNAFSQAVAQNGADLFDGTIAAPVKYDENAAAVSNSFVFTGSTATGGSQGSNCSNWTSSTSGSGNGGFSDQLNNGHWFSFAPGPCGGTASSRIYCLLTP